jgi:xanthine dehydrogenase YagT iron-sulfur-binding subunit
VEGLAKEGELSPVQKAFIEHDAFQCGFCTPGQLCSATSLLSKSKDVPESEIKEFMSGNICRCGAYSNIVDAIKSVSTTQSAGV